MKNVTYRLRRGAVTLELILVFPVWLILLLAIVEFGQVLSNEQHVALASRVGAEEAAQTAGLSIIAGDDVPTNVLGIIDRHLAASGMSRCRVVLEHNVLPDSLPRPVTSPITLSTGTCTWREPDEDLPSARQSVRVTVCARLSELAPNLLGLFGFDVSDKTIQHTTTFRYEL